MRRRSKSQSTERKESSRKVERKTANIILDLDQTLISAIEPDKVPLLPKKSHKIHSSNMDDDYVVYHRPHLQELLDFLFANFNVGIWTAATQDYALFIVKEIILKNHPERVLDFVLSDQQCELADEMYGCIKDLRLIWDYLKIQGYKKDNTFILDDNGDVFLTQLNHALPITPFHIDSNPDDKELKRLISKLKKAKARFDKKTQDLIAEGLHTKGKTSLLIKGAVNERLLEKEDIEE